MDERRELLVTELDRAFGPAENISDIGAKNVWRRVSYESTQFSGTMIQANTCCFPKDISYDPKLEGFYKIYLIIPCHEKNKLYIKLTSDEAFLDVANVRKNGYFLEEVLWRCADMTGQSITLTRRRDAGYTKGHLAGLRFVPMTDEEVSLWKYEDTRTDTRNIYATDDMHNRIYYNRLETVDDWLATVIPFRHSDVEWVSFEELRSLASGKCPIDPDEYGFDREGDRLVEKQIGNFDFDEVFKKIVDKGHECGIKMSISLRMGAWGSTWNDQSYFDCEFHNDNPQWRCVDRDGDVLSSMSYAYPEVRRYIIDMLLRMAESGCDAVTLIAHRGIPYVLFEEPVARMFYERFGEYPYDRPLDDPELNALHCEIMTGFFRELRRELDAKGFKNTEVHLRTMFSMYDTKYIGLDCETLAKEGLINAVISFPQRFYELWKDDSVWREDVENRLDLEKYAEYKNSDFETVVRASNFDFSEPYKNSRGELCGPVSQAERVAEWNVLEEKYGVKIYFEIMPRFMPNPEFKRRALELYEMGARRFGLWDTCYRVTSRAMWNFVAKLGHRDELEDMETDTDGYRCYRLKRYADKNLTRHKPNWGG